MFPVLIQLNMFSVCAGVNHDGENQLNGSKHRGTESTLIKRGKVKKDVSEVTDGGTGILSKDLESNVMENTPVISGRKNSEGSISAADLYAGATLRSDEASPSKHSKAKSTNLIGQSQDSMNPPVADSFPKDPKPLLKLKFKNLQLDSQSSWVPQSGEEDKSSVKGQRSKRKRPAPFMEKASVREDEDDEHILRDDPIDEVMDANWILKKLGKDAIGKRVEVHQSSDNSW